MKLRKLYLPYLRRCLARRALHRGPHQFDRSFATVQIRQSAPVSDAPEGWSGLEP
jgi:hypothetical protein